MFYVTAFWLRSTVSVLVWLTNMLAVAVGGCARSGGVSTLLRTTAAASSVLLRRLSSTTSRSTSSHSQALPPLALGIDFGTDSVRCMLLDLAGNPVGTVTASRYTSGTVQRSSTAGAGAVAGCGDDVDKNACLVKGLDRRQLPTKYCLQDADDWVAALRAAAAALAAQPGFRPTQVRSVGVSFTASTVVPCDRTGEPVYKTPGFAGTHAPHAWWVDGACGLLNYLY